MSAAIGLALVLAVASAVALNWGFFRQHEEAQRLPALTPQRPLISLRLLFANRRWVAGFLVGIAGWALYATALALAPLSLVQATSAGGIGILALLVWRVSGVVLSRRDWFGVAIAVGGLALLGASLGGASLEAARGSSWTWIAGWMLGSALLAGLVAVASRRSAAAGAAFGAAAGLLYAAGDVGTKAAVAGGGRVAFVPALLAAHGLGFGMLQLGFQRGGALATAGIATLFTNGVPIAAGMLLFHEPMPPGAHGMLRGVAFAAVVAGAVLLVRAGATEREGPAQRLRVRRRLARAARDEGVLRVT